jgi:hypothetical protein
MMNVRSGSVAIVALLVPSGNGILYVHTDITDGDHYGLRLRRLLLLDET